MFTTAFSQKQQRLQQESQQQEADALSRAARGESVKYKDVYKNEIIDVPAVKPEPPIDYKKEAKDFEIAFGMPTSVLKVPIGAKTGSTTIVRGRVEGESFVADPEGDLLQVKDPSIKTLKKGKTILVKDFESAKQKLSTEPQSGVGMQGGTAFIPSSTPTPLPSTQTEATTNGQEWKTLF